MPAPTSASRRNAILSVADKTGLVEFGAHLSRNDWNLFGSDGTVGALAEAEIPANHVSTLVAQAELPGIDAANLPRELLASVLAGLIQADTEPCVDLVCVNLRSLVLPKTLESEETFVDVGGIAMLAAAAKMRKIVVCDPGQYEAVGTWLELGQPSEALMLNYLGQTALQYIGDYSHSGLGQG